MPGSTCLDLNVHALIAVVHNEVLSKIVAGAHHGIQNLYRTKRTEYMKQIFNIRIIRGRDYKTATIFKCRILYHNTIIHWS